MFATSAASAAGLNTYPTDPTEAEASIAELTLGGNELISLAHSNKGSITNPGTERKPFAGSILGTEVVDFGAGFTIPMDQFIDFGQAGALLSEATATDGRNGEAISGIAGADGGLTLDGTDGDFGAAQIDLLSLFEAAGVDGVTDLAIDQADFSFGLGGAWVEAIDGVFQDPDAVGGLGQYRAADAKIVIHSPVIEQAADGFSTAAGQMEQAILDIVNPVLNLGTLIPGATIDTTITSSLQQDVLDAVLLAPITTDDGLATIDIGAGTVTVDVGRIGGNDDGVIPDRPVGINNQNPNTELIDSDTYPFIASSIHDVIEKVIDVAVLAAIGSLESVNINVAITSPVANAGWDMNLAGAVTNQFCDPAPIVGAAACLAVNTFIGTVPGLMAPILEQLTTPGSPLYPYELFTTIKTDLITVPIRAAVDPFLEIIAAGIFSVQLNHQEVTQCTPAGGTPTTGGLEVSALSFGVLGGTARFGIGNAGVRVDACNLAGPSISVTSPVPAGGETTVTSSGWAPNTQVTFQLTDADGNPVGTQVIVTTDATGNVPDGTTVPVPADATAGDYTVVGTAPDGDTASADLVVYAPTLDAQSPVAPGACSAITSGGWLPNSEVTLQLTDAAGNPVGAPVVVTTDANGNVPAGTCVQIPADAPEGDYTVVGTDGNGAEITDTVTVEIGAITPTLTVTSPVPAGGETEVTSGDWNPNSEVSLQLTDPDGNPVGDPVVVTTDANGDVPAGTTIPVPADAPAGDYTVVGTDPDGNTATAPLAVYAPTLDAQSPVAPGDCSAITSGGWLPNTQVTLQLTDAAGNPVGAPVVVTTDASGNIPAGTCVEIPADAPEGDYEIIGTDDNGAEVSDPVIVDADAITPTLTVTSPVPAGGETLVESGEWNPASEVSFQLTDADGNPVGDPVVVTTGDDGTAPAGTTVPVPDGTPAGSYTVVGSDADGNTVSALLEVYAPNISVTSPVPAGGSTEVTSGGWLPNAPVTLQLTDGAGNPVGDPVPVTTDGAGDVPAGTTVPVPADTTPGTDYSVVGTDANGAEVSDTLEVTPAAITPTLEATSPVPAGGETTVTSGGWNPSTQVTLQLTDADGNPVGDPVPVMTDAEGDVPTGTTVPVPDGTPAGAFTVVGTDAEDNTASDDVQVYAPTLDAQSPVAPGDCSAITSGGWLPNTQVTLQLTDAAGNPVGDPVVVTTDANGDVPAGTCVTIPEGTEPGDYEVVGTDDNGAEITDTVTVDPAAITPTLEATSPVPAGGETTVTSDGWAPASEVSLQLTDGDGAPVGDPVVVTTGDDGSVPAGTTVPVPAGTPAGTFTVVGTDADDNTASDEVEVYAPTISVTSPVPAGGSTEVTSDGWLPTSEVTLQLTDGTGTSIGDPVVVTTDAAGAVPAGTTVPVPSGTTPGADYSVVGTDANGAEVSDTLEVTPEALDVTLEATSPVPAGGETTVTSGGWNPGSQVSVQLTDPDGNPVGAPVLVMTDGEGDFPTGTTVPVPADATAGTYGVEATDLDGNTATDDVEVYAPTLDAESPVAPGECSVVTSGGWLPNSMVTLQLRDAAGNPVGEPVVVTADAEGNLPAGTCVPIPVDAEPGDYEVVGTDDNGAEITDPVVVDPAAIDPTIDVTSPVPAGGETTVTSGGWIPASEVSLQLTDPDGAPLGDAVVVTTGDDGSVPAGTTVPVPLTATPGSGYSVVATDEFGTDVSDTLEVTAAVIDPTLDASSPVPAGGESTVTSTGWVPESEVSLQLTDGDGAPVGDAVVVTTGGDGSVPAGTVVPVPADADAGDYTVVATDDAGNDATDTVTVYAPVISATSPVVAGDATTVTSTGWLPNSEVTLQLTDGDGNPLGDAVVVTTDGTGAIPAATTVAVPADAPAGADYSVVGTDANDVEVSATIEVLAAGTAPTLTAESPVPAGGESTVESSGWDPETEVTLQLTDGDGNPVGEPVVVTTDGDGNVPDGTTVPVPADATAGVYTIEAADGDGNEADAPVSVYAPTLDATSPVTAGDATTVTSSGWLPNSEVALQLTDGAGTALGSAVNVTTDGDGNVPAGTTVPVPADAPAGADYSVVGTDANGATASDVIEVEAAGTGPTLTATSPVPAGGVTTVTSGGWDADAEVSLQLTDADGNPVGEPVVVTTDGDGNVPAGTTVTVPETATAGVHDVVGTSGDDEATAPVLVYVPTLSVTSPVPVGDATEVTSTGWIPSSQVTLQLSDGITNLGDPVVVTTDSDGNVPAGTEVPIPADAEPGDHVVTASDTTGAELTATLAVTAAPVDCSGDPKVTVKPSTVAPGGTVTVTGTGFAAGTTASVQLYDANGKALLNPALTVTVDAACGFTTTVKIPAGANPGKHTVVVVDGNGNTGSATLTITRSLATTGGEPGQYVPLALILIALGASALILRRRGVVTDQQ